MLEMDLVKPAILLYRHFVINMAMLVCAFPELGAPNMTPGIQFALLWAFDKGTLNVCKS